jgi:hypothetical protein
MRDDFLKTTIEKIAYRAGYRCSKPDCRIVTRGAASDVDGTINVGFAAHITAASPGGARYDLTLTSNQRKHHSNGIWLCGTHAKLVDSDEAHFTVKELVSWKRAAERSSFFEVVSSKPSPIGALLTDEGDAQTTHDLLLDYSKSDLSAFQHMPGQPSHVIPLTLKMVDQKSTDVFTASGLASAMKVFDEIVVIAPPGTGKTTTLLQLTETFLNDASSVAAFIPLSEWSTRSDTFFQSLLRRASFRDANESQFELLARHGLLVFILDGWNELDEVSKRRVRNEVKSLKRDFPDIRLVVSSRHKDFDIPIDGPVVKLDVLTEEQQLEIAKALRGSEGESIMDHAWRTPGLRELVAIPLYLTALLKQATGGSLPTTKEEILRSFVTELEQDKDKMATLREILQGHHRDFLKAIAVEATSQETVVLSEAKARVVVNSVQESLKANDQISQLLQPMKVLDVLVSTHLLVRTGAESGGASFQHQQFQEWFASFWVQQLMLATTSGNNDAKKTLRKNVLDIPVWEESVLFACDRLSRADQISIEAVSSVIIETLGIDPLLSAEMIYRSSDELWEEVRDDVISFVEKWHTKGRVDRAVQFMIDTGRAEFSQYIWPLISSEDDQIHLRALRSGRKFRLSILGSDAQERISGLPEKVRVNVISEIASNGSMDGIEFSTLMAKNDTSSEVKKSVIESLLFRRADRFAKDILESAPDEIWRSLARKWHSHEFADPQISVRIQKETVKILAEETNPCRIINMLLSSKVPTPKIGSQIRELIESIDFSEKSQDTAWIVHRSHELYPKDVVGALVSLLENGKAVPYETDELLRASNLIIDKGPLIERVLRNSEDDKWVDSALSIIGPNTISKLIDQMFSICDKKRYDTVLSDKYHRLSRWISKTKPGIFIQAVLGQAKTENPDKINLLSERISRHGEYKRELLILDKEAHSEATEAVMSWAEILLISPEATRSQLAEVAQAVERLGSPMLVPVLEKMLSRDQVLRKKAKEEFLAALKKGHRIQNEAHVSWNYQYRDAFAAIGDDQTVRIMISYLPDLDFGIDAASVLKAVWQKTQPNEEKTGFGNPWPNFSVVPDNFTKRQSGIISETDEFVEKILGVIDDLIKEGSDDAHYRHALKLATIAFSMPYVDKDDKIASLLQLPLPVIDKQALLTTLVHSGEIIPSELVMQGISDLLEEAKKNLWMLQEQDVWRLNTWLCLLPFTEVPGSTYDVLTTIDNRYLAPWKLRTLLSALSYAPSDEAENVLGELAKKDERFLDEYTWLDALTKRNTLSAARILLDAICNASLSNKHENFRRMNLDYKLSAFMKSHEQFRKEIYEQYSKINYSPAKTILEDAIANVADTNGILLLVRVCAAQSKRFKGTALYMALRHALVGETPIESSNMQQLYSLPAPELRKGLFDMVINGNDAESSLATECLTAIDEIRDDYGHVDAEPRHPNITKGVPWPRIDLA